MCGQSSGLLGGDIFLYFCYVDVVLCNAFPLLYYAWGGLTIVCYGLLCCGMQCYAWGLTLCYAMLCVLSTLNCSTLLCAKWRTHREQHVVVPWIFAAHLFREFP